MTKLQQRCISSLSCVITKIAVPFLDSSFKRLAMISIFIPSRPLVGSSKINILRCDRIPQAMESRCFCPPEREAGCKIIGYAYGKHMTAELALEAVKNACLNVADTNGIILHSDLGSQYTSDLFEEYMKTHGFIHSFSRKGNPYDNACIESFHSVMKKEEIYLHTYQDFEECRKALFEYIESWYNRQRIHSALGYKTPQQMEDEAIQAA